MTKAEAKQNISKLIEKYKRIAEAGKIKSYNEAQTRNEFIEPMFGYLGWDMRNIEVENEVMTEESVSNGRVDLAFRLNNIPIMFLEAKPLKVDLDEWKWAEQAINYSWNKGVTWAVLTDFEGVKIFNAEIPPKNVSENLFFELKWYEYLDGFDQLWLLSKESFEQGLLSKEAQKWGKLIKRKQVGEKLFGDLTNWRALLTKEFKKNNHIPNEHEVDEGVQRIIDRLIFIRTSEDRGLEEKVLLTLLREVEKSNALRNLYTKLTQLFRRFDDDYNSKLFAEHYCETWNIDNKSLVEVIKGLYETSDGYRYDFSAISGDVLGGIYEQYLGYVQEKSKRHPVEAAKKAKRKSQGIFYTPEYIVDFIVKNTLGEVLKKTKRKDIHKIKVLDPACGSGSFLIKAYDTILENSEKENGQQMDFFTRSEILKDNIYGVDLDEQATEIAQLNLLLKALWQRERLPSLQHNIRTGNSLVSGECEELEKYFGKRWEEQKPFNWKEEFEEVFKGENGGFDVIIGNPPYGAELTDESKNYFSSIYDIGSTDTAILFIKKTFDLLKTGGRLGFIVPKAFCYASNYKKIRDFIWDYLEAVIDCGKAWKEVKLEQVIFVIQKGKRIHGYKSGKLNRTKIRILGKINKKNAKEFGFLLNGVSSEEVELAKKIRENSVMLNDIGVNQRGAMLQKNISKNGELEVIGGAQIQRFGIQSIKGKICKNSIDNDQAYLKNNSILVQNIVAHIENPIDHIKITATIPTKKNFVLLDTINQITLQNRISPYFIWSLLNSKLVNWYAYRFIFGKAIRTMHFDNSVTSRLPIATVTQIEQKRLIDYAEEILRLYKESKKFSKNTDAFNKLTREIEKLEQKIDYEVYKLYGLTDEEINLIENTTI